jgi:hypothetical protein
MRYHFIQEAVAEGQLKLTWIPTKDMLADVMTKVLPAPLFTKFRTLINVISLGDFETQSKEADTGVGSKEAVGMACSALQ